MTRSMNRQLWNVWITFKTLRSKKKMRRLHLKICWLKLKLFKNLSKFQYQNKNFIEVIVSQQRWMQCLGNIKQDLTSIFDDIANKHPQTKTVLHCRFQKQPPEVFCKKAFNFFKNGLHHRCFPVNIVKFLKTPIFEEYLRTATSKVQTNQWFLSRPGNRREWTKNIDNTFE